MKDINNGLQIGSSLSYQSENFLDRRQGQATSLSDLLNWSIKVPKGYEVCVNGLWYFYDPSYTSTETGHFFPRVVTKLTDVVDSSKQAASTELIHDTSEVISDLQDSVDSLKSSLYPAAVTNVITGPAFSSKSSLDLYQATILANLQLAIDNGEVPDSTNNLSYLDLNGDGILGSSDIDAWNNLFTEASHIYGTGTGSTYTVELGDIVVPKIQWKVIHPDIGWTMDDNGNVTWRVVSGQNIGLAHTAEVTGPTTGVISWDSDYTATFISRNSITRTSVSSVQYTIQATVTIADTIMNPVGTSIYKFALKTYYGSFSESISEMSNIIINSFNENNTYFSGMCTSGGTFSYTLFDCTGGKYPYILIPTTYYNADYKTYVSHNLNSDFMIKDIQLTNGNGIIIPYKMLRTTYIQTGSSIGIEIK